MFFAERNCTCNRCGSMIRKGDPVRFERSHQASRPKWGSGRRSGDGHYVNRPIHNHDCNGFDTLQAKAKAAAEAARHG